MKKISHKVWSGVLACLVVSSIATTYFVLQTQHRTLHKDLDHSGNTLARTVAGACLEHLLTEDYPFLETQIRKTAQDSRHVLFVKVFQTGDDGSRLVAQFPPPEGVLQEGFRSFSHPISVIAPDDPDSEGTVLGQIELGLSTQRIAELMWLSTWQLASGAACSFVLLVLVLRFVLRRSVLDSVAQLDRDATRIGAGDFETPVVARAEDELGRLATTMETMRVNLRESHAQIERQVEELEEHDRLKDEFLANTSHELRTPLNGIIGLADSVVGGTYGELPRPIHEPVEKIVQCGQRLRRMTDAILDFSTLIRKGTGTAAARQTRRLAEHVDAALVDLRVEAERRGLQLTCNIDPALEAAYPTDELEEVVRILTDNALKYTERGWVEIIATRWPDTAATPGFQVAVRDTGVGIPADVCEKVFEPFVQGFDHETRAHEGVGLGLAIASKRVDRLGGRLRLDSDVGVGSTFTVLIPETDDTAAGAIDALFVPWSPRGTSPEPTQAKRWRRPAGTTAGRATRSSRDFSNPAGAKLKPGTELPYHILVCDDDPINVEVLWGVLHEHYRVSTAPNGTECLEMLRENSTDLLVLDIMMPDVSGYDVLRAMKDEGLLTKTPVIVLSAKTSPESVVKGLGLGADDYLGKPFHREELRRRVETQIKIIENRTRLELEVTQKGHALEVAERANHVKCQFLANMSHEIRTPINGIMGFANLALCSEMTEPDLQREYLENVLSCTESLLEIVDDILDVAKIEGQGIDLELERAAARPLIEAQAEAWRRRASEKSLEFEFEWDERLEHVELNTNPPRLIQALDNLVDNALKFTREGKVAVRARHVNGDGQPPRLEVSVCDTGVGIDPARLEELFLPFMQADMELNRSYEGIGVGLSLSRIMARLLGGDVSGSSTPGEGSTFRLTVPLDSSSKTEHVAAPEDYVDAG